MDEQRRIITTYAWYRPTGAARRLRRAVLALANAGIPVDYVAAHAPPDLDHPLVRIHRLCPPRLSATDNPDSRSLAFWVWYGAASAVTCWRLAARAPGSRLMGFTFSAAFTLLPARLFTRRPLIVFVRSDELLENTIKGVAWPLRLVFRAFLSLLGRCATRFVAVHALLVRRLVETLGPHLAGKAEVLPNDLPAPPVGRTQARAELLGLVRRTEPLFLVVAAARFERRKNTGLLLDALARVTAPAHLVLIGDGPERTTLEQKADALGIRSRVTFAGWRDDAARLACGADVFVQPSLAEGMSNSILEALAADVPCLVSDIPVHRDVLPAELRFPTDNAAEVARRVTRLAEDADWRRQVAALCRQAADRYRFDWDAAVVRLLG